MKLSEDFSKVVVTAKMDKSAEGLIVEDAKFWVEKPRVTLVVTPVTKRRRVREGLTERRKREHAS